jgi:hypothetical protein
MIKVVFNEDKGFYPTILEGNQRLLQVDTPVQFSFLKGEPIQNKYSNVEQTGIDEWEADYSWDYNGFNFTVIDKWKVSEKKIFIGRKLKAVTSGSSSVSGDGVQFHLELLQSTEDDDQWRFFSPATLYTSSRDEREAISKQVFMDDRLTYPLVLAYNCTQKSCLSVRRVEVAKFAESPLRTGKESRYLQKTDLGSIGYSYDMEKINYHTYWPYHEGENSVALDSTLTPVSAFYPLNGNFEMDFSYEINVSKADTFANAVFSIFKYAASVNPPEVVKLPFSLNDSIQFRSESLKKTYQQQSESKAGFFFHFDPRNGYLSEPSGFSTSFITIPHESYTSIFEYGFTGRQLNSAFVLAKQYGNDWIEKGKKVIDFFISHCCLSSGWMYSLYNLKENKPFYSFGDPTAPKLHYISHGNIPGNYLRTMVEPAYDILLNYQLYKTKGILEEGWLEACKRFGEFLVKHQNKDGSWYRAYEQDGTPLKNGNGFGFDEFSSKSATAIPIIYLLSLWEEDKENGESYLSSAIKAADFVLEAYVKNDHYQGGTLDNPNLVDKEAAQYTMAALYNLYQCTHQQKYLEGANRAAQIFVTWNYIWNAPTLPNTDLQKVNFKTVGLGGINSVWGGGVVDIYSLFHIRELYLLGKQLNEPFYCEMADWIATGTQQVLSYPEELMDFKDIGMQPEGFGVCNQGIDEGMIAKGDIWGTLGWIYSAGIFGLGNYLNELEFHSLTGLAIKK